MLLLGVYSIRWNIETGYYKTKTFWSFNDYKIRSAKGIERFINLIGISYAVCKILSYYSKDFEAYKGQSIHEVRYQLGEQICKGIIIRSLEQMSKTLKNNLPIKRCFRNLYIGVVNCRKVVKCCYYKFNGHFLDIFSFLNAEY